MQQLADDILARYARQTNYAPLGREGQERLGRSRVAVIGAGGLGSALCDQLCRAGVGYLRLVDDDRVELVNLHRQHLYTEEDAAAGELKATAAARHVGRINSQVRVEPVVARVSAGNVLELIDGVDLVLDGTDNWPTRFCLNDACVKRRTPWIFAGVVAGEAVTMNILPGRTPCLRCVYDEPPPPGASPTCKEVGVLGPAVQMIAAVQAFEAIKFLSGRSEAMSRSLTRFDLWTNRIQQIDLAAAAAGLDCPCCKQGRYDFLAPSARNQE